MILTDQQSAMASGAEGAGLAFAMSLLLRFGETVGAEELWPITSAHIDGCLYHGQVSLDFVNRFVDDGCKVRVPTTLNVGSIDLIHPELFAGSLKVKQAATELMEAHIKLGCASTFTCAPYQSIFRPRFGENIAWAESNAIVFANSVLGARTARYGDFLDLAAAITGLAPAFGLHLTHNRRGRILFTVAKQAVNEFDSSVLAVAVGLVVGRQAGDIVPVIDGLPLHFNEDHLKALGAAAASTGQVAMFHAVGLTPEAPSIDAACQGQTPDQYTHLDYEQLSDAASALSKVPDGEKLSAVCLGTPHFSFSEFSALRKILLTSAATPVVPIYVNTGRATLGELRQHNWLAELEALGVIVVVDTCTYVTTILRDLSHAVMTNSGKWALYAPGNIGAKVAFGSLESCVRSAIAGRVCR